MSNITSPPNSPSKKALSRPSSGDSLSSTPSRSNNNSPTRQRPSSPHLRSPKRKLNINAASTKQSASQQQQDSNPQDSEVSIPVYNALIYLLTNKPVYTLALSSTIPSSQLPSLSQTLVNSSITTKTAPALVLSLISCELHTHQNSPQSIFRSNSLASKFLGGYVYKVGRGWLKLVLGALLNQLLEENESLEIDEQRLKRQHPDLSPDELKEVSRENAKKLQHWTMRFLKRIMQKEMIDRMPSEVFLACKFISQISDSLRLDTPVTIGAFVMLRFINPGVATPEIFNLIDVKKKTPLGQRNLILISKILQNLANGVAFSGKKEPYMTVMNDFVQERLGLMRHYFTSLVFREGADEGSASLSSGMFGAGTSGGGGSSSISAAVNVYYPLASVRLQDFDLKALIRVHRMLYEHCIPILEDIFKQGLDELRPAHVIMNDLLEFITLLESLGDPLDAKEQEHVLAYHKRQCDSKSGKSPYSTSGKASNSSQSGDSFDAHALLYEGKHTQELYSIIHKLYNRAMELFLKHRHELDNSMFDDVYFFYRDPREEDVGSTHAAQQSASDVKAENNETPEEEKSSPAKDTGSLPTYYLIARRISSKLLSKISGIFVHILKVLAREDKLTFEPIRLVVDLKFFKFQDSHTSLIQEVIDAMALFFPSKMWKTVSTGAEIIFLSANSKECEEAARSHLSYLEEATGIDGQLGEVKFFNEWSDFVETQSSEKKPADSSVYASYPSLPLLSVHPPRCEYSLDCVTVLGVKSRHIIIGPNSLLEVDPDTRVIKSEQHMITIDEVSKGDEEKEEDSSSKPGGKDARNQVKITFHPVIQSTTLFPDMDPPSSEKTFLFHSAEDRDLFCHELFETVVACTSNNHLYSYDFHLDNKLILKVMNSCILLIEKKHRKIQEILPLAQLQYARVDENSMQLKLRFMDEDEERVVKFSVEAGTLEESTAVERLLDLIRHSIDQIRHMQGELLVSKSLQLTRK